MKLRKLTIGYVLVFSILLGVGFLALQTSAQTIEATVSITPPFVSLGDPPEAEFRVTVNLPKSYKHEDIDPDSIRVEGVIPMMTVPDWPKVKKNFFAFKVHGPTLFNVIKSKVGHMAPLPGAKVTVPLTVTGLVGGTPFEGTFEMTVMTEHASPPPLPP